MLRDNLVELIEPMLISTGSDPLALCIHNQPRASDDRLPCLENPRPAGAEPSLTENVTSPFQAEPAHCDLESVNTALEELMQEGNVEADRSNQTFRRKFKAAFSSK